VTTSTPFPRRVFFWGGVWGLAVLLPQFFLEAKMGELFPPPTNHPEQYYGFLAVTVAWQLVYLAISRDVVRFRPLMPLGAACKLLFVATLAALWAAGRLSATALAGATPDVVLALLFLAAWRRCASAT
jgi:hypothetical protein